MRCFVAVFFCVLSLVKYHALVLRFFSALFLFCLLFFKRNCCCLFVTFFWMLSFRRAVPDLVRSICCRWLFSGCCEFSINIFCHLVCWLCFSSPFLFVLFAHFVILFFCYFVAGVFVPSTSAVLLRFFLLSFARSRFRLARDIRGGIWLFLVPPDSSPFTSVSAVDLHVHGAILICPAVVCLRPSAPIALTLNPLWPSP